MTIVTLLSLTSDLAVAGLVKSVSVPSRCEFGKGLVISNANTSLVTPSPNGAPVFVSCCFLPLGFISGTRSRSYGTHQGTMLTSS